MAAVYRYLIDDSLTGDHLAEVNLSNVSYAYGLNGAGGASATMSLEDPKCSRALMQTLSRDLLILRDGVPVFNGPITGLQADSEQRTLAITASPVWWWMGYRTIELARDYANADLATIFDDLLTTVNGKFAGDVRLTRSATYNAGTGQTLTLSVDSASRKIVGQVIADLSQLYPGFDWYVSLRLDPTTGKCLREYNIYAPFKGSLIDQALTSTNLAKFTQVDDGTRVFNRVHELGTGTGNTQLLVSLSGYQPASYYNQGVNDSPPVSGGTGAVITSANGYPAPSWGVQSNSYKGWTSTHGVGSTVDFDIYLGSTATYGGTANGSYFYFGCNASGNGNAFCPWTFDGSTTNRQGIVRTGAFGTSYPAANTISNASPLAANTWHHITIAIDTTTTARVWANGQQLYGFNSVSGLCDKQTFPIVLNGNYFGFWESGGAQVNYDNLAITAPTSTFSTPSIPYIERVMSRTDVDNQRSLQLYAQADLYLGAWPSLTYAATFMPSAALPFAFCAPGDTVPIDYTDRGGGYLTISGTKRVIMINVAVGPTGDEVVDLGFNDVHA